MVFRRTSMKRKRKVDCVSPLLDDSPKRTKVHAQRKFAQGSNVNSPVTTPIKELESEIPTIDVLPEPVELLPIKRPNTEDFLTFLCFRGTPILPPSLNFFNTASIVDTNGQVHEIKSESPKNGPIDIAKCGTSSEKPFIAFGVRKRADPIVISRQMDRKRRHALALQALRRKYQEQKMAKIRALTISKLSEKVTNKTLVRTNTVSKTETVTKKTNTLQKTKVVATKHVKVTTQTLKTTLRPKIKPKMCLRSFRGRFVQKELPFRKRVVPEKNIINKKPLTKKDELKKKDDVHDYASDDEEPLSSPIKATKTKPTTTKIVKKTITSLENSPRITRSGLTNTTLHVRRQQIKKRILLSTPNAIVKPRSLRSTTIKKTVLSHRKSTSLKAKKILKAQHRVQNCSSSNSTKPSKFEDNKNSDPKKSVSNIKRDIKPADNKKDITKIAELKKEIVKPGNSKKDTNKTDRRKEVNKNTDLKKSIDIKKSTDIKKESNRVNEKDKKKINKTLDIRKEVNKSVDIKKEINKASSDPKKEVNKLVDIKKEFNKAVDIKKVSNKGIKTEINLSKNTSREITKSSEIKKESKSIEVIIDKSTDIKTSCIDKNKRDMGEKTENAKKVNNKSEENKKSSVADKPNKKLVEDNIKIEENLSFEKPKKGNKSADKSILNNIKNIPNTKKDLLDVKKEVNVKKDGQKCNKDVTKRELLNKKDTASDSIKPDVNKSGTYKCKKDPVKKDLVIIDKDDVFVKKHVEKPEDHSVPKMTQRPSRKTKEAAAIYMEILSHKLVNDSKIDDDDNVSIDSFPELPNVKKTEQRENELKAQAKSTKDDAKEKSKANICEPEVQNLMAEDKNDKVYTTASKSKSGSCLKTKRSADEKKLVEKKISNENKKISNESKQNLKSAENVNHEEEPIDEIQIQKLVHSRVQLETESNNKIDVKAIRKQSPVDIKNPSMGKRKLETETNPVIDTTVQVENIRKTKIIKSDNTKPANKLSDSRGKKDTSVESVSDKDIPKRQTRNSLLINKKDQSDDSDESFHIDIKVPRRKKLTRSKTPKVVKNPSINEKLDSVSRCITINSKTSSKSKEEEVSSSDSDQSTTSDVNLQTLVNKAKNKKFSKTKSMKKTETAFSDSDEEPLSKLTNRSIEGSQKSALPSENMKDKIKQDIKVKESTKSGAKTRSGLKMSVKTSEVDLEIETIKPKRECAKRPQNYLPMLSSSDEDDIFHGFEDKIKEKSPLPPVESTCIHTPPLLDLLNKDIGRRFGKEKVNMSNEQIEKWLKESALAGSSIKKENDQMLKFGERIPTETTLEAVDHIDTQKLKCSLLANHEEKKEPVEDISSEDANAIPVKSDKIVLPLENQIKPQIFDRKLIFRKSKKDAAPNINAFSPENESSVYAFGEENEDVISTPFRRPSRRPSSTATSRSEDESSKHDDSLKTGHFRKPSLKQDILKYNKEESDVNVDTDESSHHFYIPQKPTKHNFSKLPPGPSLQKLKTDNKTVLKGVKSNDRFSETDDFKYKIPSSPSASSSSSAKLYKRQTQKQKIRPPEFMSSVYLSDFPKKMDAPKLVEAPVFHPTDQEFQDPLEYIERIRHKAEQFGICRIVPPNSFKPECKVTDDMRFTAYNQYVHKMLHRWGPNFKELMAIKKYLETQNISLPHPPWIGGMEIDLPRLYQTVQTLGGLKEVIEKKKWPRVSELMKIPKSAQDRVTKLDDIYCKYLLPYDTLSPAEREKLFDEVETEWAKRESKTFLKAQQKLISEENVDGDSETDDNDAEECITKGRNMALNAFYRIARNTMSMHFKTAEPTAQEVEQEYWKHVTMRQNHICVHSGSIDSGNWGYGFAVSKNSPFARHAWNLKVLTNNSGSVLRYLGPIMGVTVPTLHVGMVFSACCWYRDPHGLPWIEYLHTGGSKIWYGIPNSTSDLFHSALKKLVPNYCKNKELCLPSDTVMVPPSVLVENNISLCRTVQDPGQFVVVFPKAFTSSISTGYVVSESVYFAPPYWLKTARSLFEALRNSREPSMFSLDRLLLSMASDGRCNPEILKQIIPYVQELCDKEKEKRLKLNNFGTMERERMPLPEANNRKRKKLQQGEEGDYECEICRMNLFISMVFDTQEAVTYCLDHAIEMIENKKSQIGNCKFMFTYDDEEIEGLPTKIKMFLENKQQKKIPNKYAGMPTLLTK